jgi:trehalose transport system substrate-binding protein
MSIRRDRKLDEIMVAYETGRLNRRQVIQRGAALGLAVPAMVAMTRRTAAQGEEQLQLGDYEDRTLRVSIAFAEVEAEVFRDVVVQGFQDATGGEVELIQAEAADVVRTVQAQVESGNIEIDLMMQDNNTLAPLVANQLVEALPEAQEVIPQGTIQAIIDTLQFEGQFFFLPARPNVQITYYNERVFGEVGVQPPKTWDELLAAGQAIADDQGIGKVSIQGAPGGPVGVTVTQFLWQAGGDPLAINNEAGAAAFGFMQSLQPVLTPQYLTAKFDTDNTYLLNETSVLAQNWPFGINVIVDEGGKTEIKSYSGWSGPTAEVHVLGGDVFGVTVGTQNRDMALDFARFHMSREIQEALIAELGWPAMREDAFGAVADWQAPYFQSVAEALGKVQARPSLPYWGEVEAILGNAFTDIVQNGEEVQPTLDRYQGEIDALAAGG